MPPPAGYYRRLAGRAAIVTGAGAEQGIGIGRAIAVLLAGEGAFVTLVDRDRARAEETLAHIEEGGGEGMCVLADVSMPDDCARVVAQTIGRVGRLDVLVNSVGVSTAFDLFESAPDDWARIFDVNVKSVMLMAREAAPHMRSCGRGAIVNIASIAGIRAHGSLAYGSSKAAMIALTRELAATLGPDGIRVNCVAPGHVMTPHIAHLVSDEARRLRRLAGPMAIEGDAWDVAHAVCFLCTDEARFLTGTLLPVDGGASEVPPMLARQLFARSEGPEAG